MLGVRLSMSPSGGELRELAIYLAAVGAATMLIGWFALGAADRIVALSLPARAFAGAAVGSAAGLLHVVVVARLMFVNTGHDLRLLVALVVSSGFVTAFFSLWVASAVAGRVRSITDSIGRLASGYAGRSTLHGLGHKAEVVGAELVPAVWHWNRVVLADVAGSPLDDNRVTVHEADVAQMIKTAKADYDAILLDVDNGPQALNRDGNNWLYSINGLNTAFAALRPNGVLAIWSSGHVPVFAKRLRKAGFEADEVKVRGRNGRKGCALHKLGIVMLKV